MKNIIKFLSLFFVLSTSAFASSFSDTPETHKNYQAIEYLKTTGVINGYSDGTYRPENQVSRAEATKLIMKAFSISQNESFSNIFSDVNSSDWYSSYVIGAYNAGLINGYNDKTFKPDTNVSLSEALKIVLTASKLTISSRGDFDVFVDVKKDSWYRDYAYFAKQNNIIIADDSGFVYPLNPMTRGEIAEIIYRTMMVKQNNKPFDISSVWKTYVSATIPLKIKFDSDYWKISENQENLILYKPDSSFPTLSASIIFPNSGKILIDIDKNTSGLSSNQYFSNIKNSFPGTQQIDFKYLNYDALEIISSTERKVDWYIYIDSSNVLGIFTEYGSGNSGYKLSTQIKSMLSSIEIVPNFSPSSVATISVSNSNINSSGSSTQIINSSNNYENLLSEIFSNILIANKGMQMLNKLPSKIIIETDTIGVGTGPVDYYYSQETDYTFKYERADDLILDKRKGKTSSF